MAYGFTFPKRAEVTHVRTTGCSLHGEGARIDIDALTDDLIRLRMVPPHARGPASPGSYAVAKTEWNSPTVHTEEGTDSFTVHAAALVVRFRLRPFHIEVERGNGTPLLRSAPEGAVGWRGGSVAWRQHLPPDEYVFGLGEKMGPLQRRGHHWTMGNGDSAPHLPDTDPLYASIPFLIGFREGEAYGLLFDNTYRTHFDLGAQQPDVLAVHSEGGHLDVYVFAGPDMKHILHRYSELTGNMPLPPLWALGYQQCRYSYENERQAAEVARTLREHHIPCDALYLDIHYMDEYRVFTFDSMRFPEPARLVERLRDWGYRVVTIVDPGVKVDPDYSVYREGQQASYWATRPDGTPYVGKVWPGDVTFPDFTRAAVRRWWARQHKPLFDAGISGIWNDMNEPAVFEEPGKTLPPDVEFGEPPERLLHTEVHNVYGQLMAEATREAFRHHRPGKRPFIISRAGYAGIQRHAVLWTGDNSSWWEHLLQAIPMCLSLGLSGIPFSGADVGGFLGHCNGELLTRWTQLGTFTPLFRNHSVIGSHPQEPYAFGEPYESICRRYIQLRYQLLPYLYTLVWEANRQGLPIMRPMVLEFPHDQHTPHLFDQFMCGPYLLIAPIYLPGAAARSVYLPAGRWVNLWSGDEYSGGRFVTADAPLETIPVFLRHGATVPYGRVMNYTGEHPQRLEALDLYPAAFGDFALYVDDGESLDYEQGAFGFIRWTHRRQESELVVTTEREGDEQLTRLPWDTLRVQAVSEPPQAVEVNGEPLSAAPNLEALQGGKTGWYLERSERRLYVGLHRQQPECTIHVHW